MGNSVQYDYKNERKWLEREFLKLDVTFTGVLSRYYVKVGSNWVYKCVTSCRSEEYVVAELINRFKGDDILKIEKELFGERKVIYTDVQNMDYETQQVENELTGETCTVVELTKKLGRTRHNIGKALIHGTLKRYKLVS
jgi:hypothetical protein